MHELFDCGGSFFRRAVFEQSFCQSSVNDESLTILGTFTFVMQSFFVWEYDCYITITA